MSVPHSNSTHTIDRPMPDADRTRCTPVAPLSRYSSCRVTSVSTSSGARPGASVITVTVGRLRSGNTSTGILASAMMPATTTASPPISTRRRFRSEKAMMALSMMQAPAG
jgi:hypothetical protein